MNRKCILAILLLFGMSAAQAQPLQGYALFDLNNISMAVSKNGALPFPLWSPDGGFEWPRGSNMHAIYQSGIWLAAKVRDTVRVATNEYLLDFRPGNIIDSTGRPADANDSTFRVYKIQQYDTTSMDYVQWPLQLGAPRDRSHKPLLLGEQTLWCVYNDLDTGGRRNFASQPLGVEVQQTVFGYRSFSYLFDNLVIVRFLIINKSKNTLDSMYFAFWSWPTIGTGIDNRVGCDSILSLWYAYHYSDSNAVYGLHPPAVGYVILQGPLVLSEGDSAMFIGHRVGGYMNLPMSSFILWQNDASMSGIPQTGKEVYYYMTSRWRNGQHITYGGEGTNPNAPPTDFMYSGDPETGTGWLSTFERHEFGASGPFTMAPGDTQEVVMGILVSQGTSNTNSVTKLRNETRALHAIYSDSLYKLFSPPPPYVPRREIPELYHLSQNFPNPFNAGTLIQFGLPKDEEIFLAVFNILGQRVATLASGFYEAGTYTVRWEPGSAATGVYIYQLEVGRYVRSRRMILLK